MNKSILVGATTILTLVIGQITFIPASATLNCSMTVTTSNTTVNGTSNGDVICLNANNLTVNALGGNDTVIDNGSNNTIFLGEGLDVYIGTDGDGGTVDGGPGNDTITGTPGEDELSGGDGDDALIGGDGNDTLNGGQGNDDLAGSAGNDTINGDPGDDSLNGGDGTDAIDGGDGVDTLVGGSGNDTMNGGLGTDELAGGIGDDELYGEAGEDTLRGEEGDDVLAGGVDIDSIDGGLGLNYCDFTTGETLKSTCIYDDHAPNVSTITWDPPTVEVTNSAATTRLAMRVEDASGIDSFSLSCEEESSISAFGAYFSNRGQVGTLAVGVLGGTGFSHSFPVENQKTVLFDEIITFPRGFTPGLYKCYLDTKDVLGNYSRIMNFTSFSVSRAPGNWDDAAPLVSNISFGSKNAEVGTADALVRVKFTVSDSSGVESAKLFCYHPTLYTQSFSMELKLNFRIEDNSWTKSTFSSRGGEQYLSNSSVRNIKSETFNELVTIPRGMPPGRYLCNTYTRDIVGRGGYKWGITSFVITRTSGNHDDQGPIFSEIVWGPAVVDVGSSDSVAKLNFTVSDASGIEIVNLMCKLGESEFSVNIENNFGRWRYVVNTRSSQVVSYHPISNNRSLTFDGEIVLPVGQNPGRYTCMTHTFDTLRNEGFIANGTFLDIYRTPAGQPSAPIAVQLVANRPTVATLEWSPPVVLGSPSMYAYVTEISTDGTSWKALANGATTETSLEVKNLKPGTRYWLRVRGENGGTLGQSTRYMNLNWATTSFTTPLAVVPDPPTSLQISQVKANSFKLDWTVPIYSGGRNISNFSVEVSTDNGETWRSAKAKASTSKSLTVTGAAPVTRYLIRVAAVNVIGSSEYLTGEVSTLATVPSAPRSLAISNLDTTSLLLSWMIPASNGGADITDYKVEFAVGNSNTWTEITHEVSNNLGFDVTGLSPNRAYRFRVSGINSYGRGPTSNIVSATTLVSLPAEPTNVAASRATATTASLAWRAPTNTGGAALSDYRVEISRDGGTNWSTVSKRASNSTSLALTGLAPSTTYQVRVAAVNARGAGPTVVGSLTTLVGPPSAPANLRSSDVTGTTATIAWDLPASNGGSAITSYRVEVSSNCSSYTTLSRTASNSLAQSVTNLKPGLRYCFRVSTINSVGISPASTVLQLTTVGNAPNAPTALSVRASATQVTLSWRAATVTGGGPVRNYIVEYSRDSGENWISVVKPVSTSTSIAIRNLTRSTAYLFRVYAVNDSGQSQASANLAVTTPAR